MTNKNGKLFGKINIVDALAIVSIVILIVGIGYRFTGKPTQNVATHEKFEYVVGIADVRYYTVEGLQKMGDVFKAKTHEKAGTIKKVEAIPYKKAMITADGTTKDIEIPNKYEIRVTIETEGRIGETLYLDSSNREIYVGGNIDWYSKWVEVNSSQVKAIIDTQE